MSDIAKMILSSLLGYFIGVGIGWWVCYKLTPTKCCPPHRYKKVKHDDLFPFFFCVDCGDKQDPIGDMRKNEVGKHIVQYTETLKNRAE